MRPRFFEPLAAMIAILVYGLSLASLGHAADAAGGPAPAAAPSSQIKSPQYRELAPGVEITIPPDRDDNDTHDQHDIVEILQSGENLNWVPKTAPTSQTLADKSRLADFRHRVWYLEFTFKPVRMIWVDVPQDTGKAQRKLIWYMVYRVKNMGGHLAPAPAEAGGYTTKTFSQDVRFFPHFVIEAPDYKKEYLDRLIPVAVEAIQQREDPQRKLLNTVEISTKPIPTSTDRVDRSVWGVATWQDLDPRIDAFTVYVQGLTNAYRWRDKPGGFKKGDPPGTGRVLTHKTLVLNFWRPGDEFVEDKRIIRFGAPGKVDSTWVYR